MFFLKLTRITFIFLLQELKESQLELNELKNELASKENDNINLNFKVKELKAHVEEKTRLIESYNIKGKFILIEIMPYYFCYIMSVKQMLLCVFTYL